MGDGGLGAIFKAGAVLVLKGGAAYLRGMDGIGRSTKRTGTATDRLTSSVGKLGGKIVGVGKSTLVLGTALLTLLGAPIVQAAQLEDALADVSKTTGLVGEGLHAFKNELKALDLVTPTKDLTQLAAAGGMMGVAQDQLLGFTRDVSMVAVAFDQVPEEAARSFGRLANIFGVPHSEILSLANPMNALSDQVAASGAEILQFTMRAGGLAKTLGFTAEETAAFGATMIAAGESPERAATAFNFALNQLNAIGSASGKARRAFRALGLDTKTFGQTLQADPMQALSDFIGRVETSKDPLGTLSAIIGNEAAPKFVKLTGNLGELNRALGIVGSETTTASSVQDEYARRTDTLAGNLQRFKKAAGDLGDTIGSFFLPVITAGTRLATRLSRGVSSLSERYPLLSKGVAFTAAGLGVLLIVGGGLITTLGLTLKALSGGVSGFRDFSGQLTLARRSYLRLTVSARRYAVAQGFSEALALRGARSSRIFGRVLSGTLLKGLRAATSGLRLFRVALLTTGIGAGLLALAAAGTFLVSNWSAVKTFFSGFLSGLAAGFRPVLDAIAPLLDVLRPIGQALGSLWQKVTGLLGPLNLAEGQFSTIAQVGKVVGFVISTALITPLQLLIGVIKGAFGFWKRFIGGIMEGAALIASGRWKEAGSKIVRGLWEGIKAYAMKPVEAIKSIVSNIRDYLPFSPAKRGPLSDLDKTGLRLSETIATGITGHPIEQALGSALRLAPDRAALPLHLVPPVLPRTAALASSPAASRPRSRVLEPIARPGAESQARAPLRQEFHFAPTITIQGPGSRAEVEAALEDAEARFRRQMQRWKDNQDLSSF